MNAIRILLADDHTLVRAGVRALLEELPDVTVVAEAADGHQALAFTKAHQPHVVFMDVAMSGLNGLETTARMAKEFPDVRVIILSMHANEEYIWQALRAGASGYLLKSASTAELELALKAVGRGETYLDPGVARRVIAAYVSGAAQQKSLIEQLSPRQREILQLVAEGRTTKEIAFVLNLSVKTVETHRAQLMERLDIHDVPGLVRYAIRQGLVSVEP
ncbi:MAG TPA: response regulator transcription factor [Verrucomicrobiae bacterium]|nr:response regulator transcription factor [Verrucomicrobiae bacterium]